jgi:hypothetical protein
MNVRRGILTLWLLLLAAVVPLHAQFTTYGCPPGYEGPPLNGFTAGTVNSETAASQICLSGAFQGNMTYSVTLTRADTQQTFTTKAGAQANLIQVFVSDSFYATDPSNGVVPVTINIFVPSLSGTDQTGSFQINPPLTPGAQAFISAVNTAVSWTLFTGGTQPYSDSIYAGNGPTGMADLPPAGNTWAGIPNQTGVFQVTTLAYDGWGNQLFVTSGIYIVPAPQILNINPTSALVGSGPLTMTINGSGFVLPVNNQQFINVPGSLVQWTPPGLTLGAPTLTGAPVGNQLTVTIPANLLTNTGIYSINVLNPASNTSNAVAFTVNPSITALSTYTRTAGAPPFTLGVTGAGFANGSVVRLNGTALPTTFLSSTSLTATFPTVPAPGSELITVVNADTTVTPVAQTLTVVPSPILSALKPSSVNAGSPAFTLLLTGSNFSQGMVVYFGVSPLPAALVPNQQNNQLTVSVPALLIAQAGSVPVSVFTADGYSTPSLPFTIVSTGPPPLQLQTLSPLPPGMVNTPYSTTIVASQGAGGYTFSVIAGAVPAGLALSPAGVLSGTPTAYGPSQFTVQVADSAGNTVSRLFTLNVAPAPLTLTTGPLANMQVNTPISIQFAGSGGIPPYTFVEFGALPPGTSINGAGLLSGTPTKAGTYPLLVFIDDTTGASVSKNYTLNIALPGLLITPPSPLPSGQINVPYTTQLAATGGVGSPYTWSATGLPSGLTIANTTGLITGIPRASGPFTIAVTVGDLSGAAATQNYALTIAAASLTFSGITLSGGAVGIPYTSAVSVTGGAGPYTFAATGLPPGLTLSPTGTLSGTPTTAGAYQLAVTATDLNGATVSGSFSITIAQKLAVTATAIPNAVVGTAISAVQLTATGGTPPYQWQSATLPPGLSLAPDGTLSGTPTAAGSFTFLVYAVDSNGVLASGSEQMTVGLPATTAANITGLPPSTAPAAQQSVTVTLANPYPAAVTANLILTFAPTSGADDPSIQFSTGGRTAQVTIPAGSTEGVTSVGVQTGTVAGTITITAQLLAGTTNVTPTPAPTTTIIVTAEAPVITAVTANRTSSGFTVTVTGYASNRDVDSATYLFSPSEGATLATSQVSTPVTSLFTQWYGNPNSAPYGSQFTLTQPFTVSGSTSSILSVSVTLTNALGTSPAISAILQ